MAEPSLITCVALIGRNNQPLYLKTFGEEPMKLQLAVYASLDQIEDKVNERRAASTGGAAAPASSTDAFLGLLYPVEEHKVFGYVTNTNVKIVVAVRDVLLREDRVRDLFRRLHVLYVDAASNPFAPPDGAIASPRFEEAVYRIVEAANQTLEYRGPMPV